MRSVQDDNSSFSNEPLGSFNTSQGLSFYMRPKNQNNLSEDGAGFLPSNPSSRVRPSTAFRPATARILGGQNPEKKKPFPFSKEISPPPNQKCKECFSFGVSAESARRWRGDCPSVRFRSEPPRAPREIGR